MPGIVYALVARQTVVLCEHSVSGVSGNFNLVAHKVLERLPKEEAKVSFSQVGLS